MKKINSVFAKDGLLADVIPGFLPRDAQTQMANAVNEAIAKKQQLVVEAGTGTGKTFAYLVPALMNEGKTIISTGTKNLQEQLFHRDLPIVKKALGSYKQTALLKGRSNYLCKHRLSYHSGSNTLLDAETLHEFSQVRRWASTTKSGDIGELKSIPENAKVLPFVTSNVDNCLGKECPDYDECYLVKARGEALEADVIVVNHHLFFADLALKDTGFGELIPDADTIIFDEAHQIGDIASEYFGQQFSTRLLHDSARDIYGLFRTTLKDIEQADKAAKKLASIATDLRSYFPEKSQKGKLKEMLWDDNVVQALDRLCDTLKTLVNILKVHIGRDKELDNIYERLVQAKTNLKDVTDISTQGVSLWYETTPKQVVLHLTPLSIADKFNGIVTQPKRTWVFTSATLMVDNGFAHFTEHMGLGQAQTLALDSPFDYYNQAMLCVPHYLPEPSNFAMKDTLIRISMELIAAAKGRCFLLFTSHAMLREVAAALAERIDNELLVQGTTTKQALLDSYLENKESVLLATGAFWEGVDVRGDDLLCVLIDKLPFASPDDPLLQAKVEDAQKRGKNSFMHVQIPQAVITLKQGAGRLIRDETDKGVLVICDSRLVTKDYGKIFLASLPPMRRTRDMRKATQFLTSLVEPIA